MLPAIGVSLVYAILRIPQFAYAELMTVGAYLTFGFSAGLGLPFLASAMLAVGLCGLLAAVVTRRCSVLCAGAGCSQRCSCRSASC